MTSHNATSLAKHARHCRAWAAAATLEECGPGGNRYAKRCWEAAARRDEDLLRTYATHIERGYTASDSRLVAMFEGSAA
jgi:hypothetical protein